MGIKKAASKLTRRLRGETSGAKTAPKPRKKAVKMAKQPEPHIGTTEEEALAAQARRAEHRDLVLRRTG